MILKNSEWCLLMFSRAPRTVRPQTREVHDTLHIKFAFHSIPVSRYYDCKSNLTHSCKISSTSVDNFLFWSINSTFDLSKFIGAVEDVPNIEFCKLRNIFLQQFWHSFFSKDMSYSNRFWITENQCYYEQNRKHYLSIYGTNSCLKFPFTNFRHSFMKINSINTPSSVTIYLPCTLQVWICFCKEQRTSNFPKR